MTEQAIELRDAREQITRLRSALASAIGDRQGRVYQAMNEAYWQAARAVCSRCAEGVPAIKENAGYIHKLNSPGGVIEEPCEAGPIHALIEKLNEGEK